MLSSFRLMWLLTLFDLPVTTKKERQLATGFRNSLLDKGFEMVQYSVYMKNVSGKEQAKTIIKSIHNIAPNDGNIKVIQITDKQFGSIQHIGKRINRKIDTRQLALF